jgi:hypothetical protein
MAKIEIPEMLRKKLGAEMKMDVHWVDVKLQDGRILKNLIVRGGRYITAQENATSEKGDLSFKSEEIVKIRRHSIFPFW